MPVFDFSLIKKAKNKREVGNYTVIERNCEGVIIKRNGIYKVLYNNKEYSITTESYKTKHRRTIYARFRDKFGHRIKIIRDKDSRIALDTRFYCGICDGLICKGKIVKAPFQQILFHIRVCYNPADVDGTSRALKEWRDYKQAIENKEIDERFDL